MYTDYTAYGFDGTKEDYNEFVSAGSVYSVFQDSRSDIPSYDQFYVTKNPVRLRKENNIDYYEGNYCVDWSRFKADLEHNLKNYSGLKTCVVKVETKTHHFKVTVPGKTSFWGHPIIKEYSVKGRAIWLSGTW